MIWVLAYVYSVIKSVNLDKIASVYPRAKNERIVSFEEGGIVKKDVFDFFYSKTTDKRFFSVIKKNLRETKDHYIIEENFVLEPLIENECTSLRCIQYRIPFSNIPNIFSKGLIGIEDYRFLNHFGVDLKSILRAIIQDIKAGSFVQGGSTLTQQVVKNIFYTNEKSLERKIKEAIVAIYLESKLDKTTILQTYFNEVYWGSLGGVLIKGIEAASRIYFNKHILDVSSYEVSILISMLKGPNYYHPIRRTERLRKRANFIYKKLKGIGFIPKGDQSSWNDEKWNKWVDFLKTSVEKNLHESFLLTLKNKRSENDFLYFNSILAAENLLKRKEWRKNSYSVKMISGSSANNGKRLNYYSRFERDIEKALTEEFVQVGSTLKPLIYKKLIDRGLNVDDTVTLEPITLKLISGDWTPRESHSINENEITLERALQESFNIPVVKLVQKIGFEKIEKDLKGDFPKLLTPLAQYPAQLLGALELSVSDMFNAYSNFFKKDCVAGNQNSITKVLSDPTKTTIKRRVGKSLKNQRFFGKTGTSNNGLDNWFIGYDGKDLFVIWFGVDGNRAEVEDQNTYGSNTAFLIYKESVTYSGRRLSILPCLEK